MGDDDCRDCRTDRQHCHGTLVRHPGRYRQCTDPDCAHPEPELHTLSIDCEAADCECAESPTGCRTGDLVAPRILPV